MTQTLVRDARRSGAPRCDLAWYRNMASAVLPCAWPSSLPTQPSEHSCYLRANRPPARVGFRPTARRPWNHNIFQGHPVPRIEMVIGMADGGVIRSVIRTEIE